jgi:hypothetical protein
MEEVWAYIRHTRNVGEHAQVNFTSSVMMYDHQFRKKEATGEVHWGNDDSHLAHFHLERRPDSKRGQQNNSQKGFGRGPTRMRGGGGGANTYPRSPQGKELCREWQTEAGCSYGARCKFTHGACSECQQSHPQYLHSTIVGFTPGQGRSGHQ